MQPVVTPEEMRWCDEQTIASSGVPGMLLMENAGRSVVDVLDQEFAPLSGKHIVVICGKGNNGGDGFVIARHLSAAGARTTVFLAAQPADVRGDARTNLKILQRIARDKHNAITLQRATRSALRSIGPPDVIVDALFGTGFTGSARKPASDLIAWMNEQNAPAIAVDIPSGVDGETGRVGSVAVEASATVTFGLLKSGLVLNEGRDAAGRVYVADIGFPPSVVRRGKFQTFFVDPSDVRSRLPKRPFDAHKYSTGKVLLIAGSRGYTGAASLCATAALRSGAGAVMLLTPESVYPVLAKKLSEVIVRPLPATPEGSVSRAAEPVIREQLHWADVVVLGPGLSQESDVAVVVRNLLEGASGRWLIDADGLNAIASLGPRILKKSKADILLTPHTGEFSRLTGTPSAEIESHRIDAARTFAKRFGVSIVLKGVPTATAVRNGDVYLNPTGNPGMATAGSGDVLAGLIAGCWAQGMDMNEAAWAGAYLHGLSGDTASEKIGERSLIAGDLIDFLPEAIRRVERGETA